MGNRKGQKLARKTVKAKDHRARPTIGGQPTYFICDGCGRTFNTVEADRRRGVCKECSARGIKQSGKARGYLAMSGVAEGRIIVQNPVGARSRPEVTAADLARQSREAGSAQEVWKPTSGR